jgi:hypothetical protein
MTPGFFSIETARFDPELVALLEEALKAIGPHDIELRIRLLGRLATALYWSDNFERRQYLSEEAVELVDNETEDELVAYALYARHCALWAPENVLERVRLAEEAVRRTDRSMHAEANLLYRTMLITDRAELGDVRVLDEEISRYSEVSEKLRQAESMWLAPMFKTMRALMAGRFSEVEELCEPVRVIGARLGSEDAANAWAGQMMLARFEMGEGELILPLLRAHVAAHPKVLLFRAAPAWFASELGRREEARVDLEYFSAKGFLNVPRDMNWLGTLCFLALACGELREVRPSEQLLRLLEPYVERFAVLGHGTVSLGSVASHVARLASIVGECDLAKTCFQAGRAMNEAAGATAWVARGLFDEARELTRWGELTGARERLGDARQHAARLEMTHLVQRIEVELSACSTQPRDQSRNS